jgi:hypothetical protein
MRRTARKAGVTERSSPAFALHLRPSPDPQEGPGRGQGCGAQAPGPGHGAYSAQYWAGAGSRRAARDAAAGRAWRPHRRPGRFRRASRTRLSSAAWSSMSLTCWAATADWITGCTTSSLVRGHGHDRTPLRFAVRPPPPHREDALSPLPAGYLGPRPGLGRAGGTGGAGCGSRRRGGSASGDRRAGRPGVPGAPASDQAGPIARSDS